MVPAALRIRPSPVGCGEIGRSVRFTLLFLATEVLVVAKYVYDDYVVTLANRFTEALQEIDAEYNFDLGPEFEVAICKVLRRALPQKYGICRGFVVDVKGECAGDDIIIYDRARFPTLRLLKDEDYSRKERIPIEAVYAYIEAKTTLEIEGDGNSSLQHSSQQLGRVRSLVSRRDPVLLTQIHPYINVEEGTISVSCSANYPKTRNPMFGMIVARQVRKKANSRLVTDMEEIRGLLETCVFTGADIPDCVIAGKDVVVIPVIPGVPTGNIFSSPFQLDGISKLIHRPCPGISYGIGLCMLLFALDWIQLGIMAWGEIVGNALLASNE